MVDIVIWSGGYDSTLILDQLCSSGDKNVWAFSINWGMLNSLKCEKEKEVRENYKNYAERKGYSFCYQTITVESNMGAGTFGNPQALAWLSFIAPYLPKESRIHFGYHMADCFWCNVHYAEKAIKNLCAIGERKVIMKYPLRYSSKWEIVEDCKKRGIPNSCIWSCERPVKKRNKILTCGSCNPCINLKLSTYEKEIRSM